jgi:hypothetical protein
MEDGEPEAVEDGAGYGLFKAADWMCSLHVERQCSSRSLFVAERFSSKTYDVSEDQLC